MLKAFKFVDSDRVAFSCGVRICKRGDEALCEIVSLSCVFLEKTNDIQCTGTELNSRLDTGVTVQLI